VPPATYGTPSAPPAFGQPASGPPNVYGAPAQSAFGQPSAPPNVYGTPTSGPPAEGSHVPAPALPSWPQSTNPTAHGGYAPPPEPAPLPDQVGWGRDERGTTYGGPAGVGSTMSMPGGGQLENSGSLTGHILAQGRADGPAPRSNTAKVLLIGAVLLVVLVLIGLLAATVAGDAVTDMFSGILDG
jgi:hypothetical protein